MKNYYDELFCSSQPGNMDNVLDGIDYVVNQVMNETPYTRVPTHVNKALIALISKAKTPTSILDYHAF